MSEQELPSSNVASTPHRKSANRKRKLPEPAKELATSELTQGFSVLLELLKGHKTFFYPPDSSAKNMIDYYEVVKEPMWLDEMRRRFESGDYTVLSQFAADMRLLLENCYRFFGPNNLTTKRALKLEHTYVECVSLLPRELQSQCCLLPDSEFNAAKDGEYEEEYESELLERIIAEQKREEEEHRRKVAEQVVITEDEKDIIRWEREVLVTEDMERQIKGMWELPLIGQFIYLALDALNIDEISMYEVERMLLMPQASQALARLVTSLLISPMFRQRLVRLQPMSYHVWSRRLADRVASWYRVYVRNEHNAVKTLDMIGVETEFWTVLGQTNPLQEHQFHELNFHQRVWVLKSLCDFCLHNQSSVRDTVGSSDVRDSYKHNLGVDRNDCRYEHLPELCGDDVRVYRQTANAMSLIERDEVYWEGVAAKTGFQDDASKDSRASESYTSDASDARKRKGRRKSTESDSGLSCNSVDIRQCDDLSNELSRGSSSTILARHDYIKSSKLIHDPHWLSSEDSGFEIVADSLETLNELIVKFGGDISDQRHCNIKPSKKKMPKCEADLLKELQILASNLKRFEVEFIVCMKKARKKMYKEWQEYQKRSSDFVDPSDAVWNLSADQHDIVDEKADDKIEAETSMEGVINSVNENQENHNEEIPEHKSEDSEGRERYSRRAKRKVDMAHVQLVMNDNAFLLQDTLNDDLQLQLLDSDLDDYEVDVEEEDDDDDVWEMPGKKKKVSKPKPPGRKCKLGGLDAALSDSSAETPKAKKSSVKKIASTSNKKVASGKKSASRKLFCNENPVVSSVDSTHVSLASPSVTSVSTCESLQKFVGVMPQKSSFTAVSVKNEVETQLSAETLDHTAGWQENPGNIQMSQENKVKQEIKEERQEVIKQESASAVDSNVQPATRQNVEFQPSTVPLIMYQSQTMTALTGTNPVIIVPFPPTSGVTVAQTSEVRTPVPVSQLQTAAQVSHLQMSVPVSQVHTQATAPMTQVSITVPTSQVHSPVTAAPAAQVPGRQTVLQRVGGLTPVISSDVICLDTDSSDSDVEFVGDIKPASPKQAEQKLPVSNSALSAAPGKLSVVPVYLLKNEVTPPKNVNHPLSTLKQALDKRLNPTSGETPQEMDKRLPGFTAQPQYKTVPNTPPAQTLSGTTNISMRNITPARSSMVHNLLQGSPNLQKQLLLGKGTDALPSLMSTPKKQPTTGYPTTPRNILPSALTNPPRGGSPSTFSPSTTQWNSSRGQYSPRPAARGRASYAVRQLTPVRGPGVARGRASPMQSVATSPGPRARLCQPDKVTTSPGSLPIVGDVDHTTGTFRYALVMSNGSRIPLTPEQVDQIRKGNNGMLPSSL